ncbi:hypothetical protein D7Z26_00365 [Cohnella endophytica]|uniref:Peptidase MA-like domain-containing protein n=1 Tax=Cohnella endophytica TaxID=2419778 RepID=A0A494YCI8_9BACL|nr:hypothetical protein [Cohnella endophytica]RKP58001.1 hypothetical protein D7Z26_00365 [Cohnella endophytica]
MIRILSQEFENQEQRITELFNYHSDKKTVIHVYAEVSQFYDVVGRVTEGTYDLDDNTIKIYTPLNLSSPSVRSEYVFQLIHEFVHSVIQQINSKIGQVKWLDEGTAYYASGQLEAELKSPTRHPVFPDFEQVASPSFFDVFNQSAYFYSGTIVKFITDKYGQESLNKVIRNPDHFEELLNVSFQTFYEEWKAWSNHSLMSIVKENFSG